MLLLAKNPTGTNETVRTVLLDPGPLHLLIALNDRTADGHDVSWIWDVDYEPLLARAESLTVTGDRAYDLALRVRYAGVGAERMTVVPDPEAALDAAVAATPPGAPSTCSRRTRPCSACARCWCGAGRRRRSGVSDETTRRAASRSSTRTTTRTCRSGAPPRRGPGRRCSTSARPRAGWRSRSRATATRSGPSTAPPRCSPSCAAAWSASPPPCASACGSSGATSPRCALPRAFALVIVAMNTLQVLTEPADRLACLRGVREHLADGGELAFDVGLPDEDEIVETMGVERSGGDPPRRGGRAAARALGLVRPLGAGARRRSSSPCASRSAPPGGGPPRVALRRHRVHLFSPEEIAGLLADAGLEAVEVAGGFDGSPLRPGCERQVYRCRAAA